MNRPVFLVTIDTEGDDIWSAPPTVTTKNSKYLPAFQELCERYGLKPTYFTNYEMASCPVFREFARDVVRREKGEIGMHLHAWNSPPLHPLTADDIHYQPYLIEYPPEVMRAKIAYITSLLEDTFGRRITSHRAGRWAFNGEYARALIEHGYEVDSSVIPGLALGMYEAVPHPDALDYTTCGLEPYLVDLKDIRRPGESSLLEVPLTSVSACPPIVDRIRPRFRRGGPLRRMIDRFWPPFTWVRPNGGNLGAMMRVLTMARKFSWPVVIFMLHSSELMPGGSPYFTNGGAIDGLYRDMETLFAAASSFTPMTVTEFARWYIGLPGSERSFRYTGVNAGERFRG